MANYIWFNPGRFLDLRKTEQAGGMQITVELSPYETPKGLLGKYDQSRGEFSIEFRYIDHEPCRSESVHDGIRLTRGRHTGKLLTIAIPVDKAPHDTTCVIELKTKIIRALEEEFSINNNLEFELNLDAAKSVINEELSELVLS
jgi:hypothetical protein